MESTSTAAAPEERMKFCKYCGRKIHEDAVICPLCGRQVEDMKKTEQPNIVINNSSQSTNSNVNNLNSNITEMYGVVLKNKWVAFFLCLFLGCLGAHKFYEGKAGMGILYLLTAGLFGLGWFIDCIVLLCKPNPYYVH